MAAKKTKVIDQPEVSEGPFVSIPNYWNNFRHWSEPTAAGEPRTIDLQFRELEREGIACLYDVITALVYEQYPHGSVMRLPTTEPNLGRWGDMLRERADVTKAWAKGNGTWIDTVGTRPVSQPVNFIAPYGKCYLRARLQLSPIAMLPNTLTIKEAADRSRTLGKKIGAGQVGRQEPTQWKVVTAEQVGFHWAALFANEVRQLLGREPTKDLVDQSARLHANLTGYEFGKKGGGSVLARLKSEASGCAVLEAFNRIRIRLNGLMDEVANDNAQPKKLERVNAVAQPQQVPPTFLELLGKENLATTLAAIAELQYRPVSGRGKGLIIACMEAALEHFEVPIPSVKHWPSMLEVQFSGIDAGTKAAPPIKPEQRTKAYKVARAAMFDMLGR